MQIYKNFGARKAFFFKGPNRAIQHRFQTCGSDLNLPMRLASRPFSGISLADETFRNSISSSIVRYCVFMSA
jgi:hypothetical protein